MGMDPITVGLMAGAGPAVMGGLSSLLGGGASAAGTAAAGGAGGLMGLLTGAPATAPALGLASVPAAVGAAVPAASAPAAPSFMTNLGLYAGKGLIDTGLQQLAPQRGGGGSMGMVPISPVEQPVLTAPPVAFAPPTFAPIGLDGYYYGDDVRNRFARR